MNYDYTDVTTTEKIKQVLREFQNKNFFDYTLEMAHKSIQCIVDHDYSDDVVMRLCIIDLSLANSQLLAGVPRWIEYPYTGIRRIVTKFKLTFPLTLS